MGDYRLYLIQDGHVLMGQNYTAPTDTDAIAIGTAVARACDDIISTIEIWEGARAVYEASSNSGNAQAKFTQHHQMIVVDLEDRLRESHDAVARSRKLLAASSSLRHEIKRQGGAVWNEYWKDNLKG